MPHRLLAGDIGGTNSRLVLYTTTTSAPPHPSQTSAADLSTHTVVAQNYYKNHEFSSFTEVLCAFTAQPSVRAAPIDACCLATAGPVADNRINFTNREGWIIDGRVITEEFGIPHVQLVNDFVAAGYGLLGLDESEVLTLQEGAGGGAGTSGAVNAGDAGEEWVGVGGAALANGAPMALVGAGTGLGECFLTPDESGVYRAFATEGGHVEFAPRTELEEQLLHYLQERLDLPQPAEGARARVSVERVVSGKGLENIYEFLRAKYPDQVDQVLNDEYNGSAERGRLMGAQKYNYSLFAQAFELMMAIYGGEVGNAALKYLPYAGLYVAGGIAPKNVEYIQDKSSPFMQRLLDKGRMRSIMHSFPIHVVMKEDLGLRGAHIVASRLVSAAVHKQQAHSRLQSEDATAAPLHDPVSPRKLNGFVNGAIPADSAAAARFRSQMPLVDAMRNAVSDYPLAYAALVSLTAGFTATAITLGGKLLGRVHVSPAAVSR